ncbi:MAG: hypothetical protein UR93_C0019G0006 [Berkelbacteria bacterium GW2011_GWA2_35_9]|uniref:YGGT family protein n=1 Tax=Berkelbacteria bacterium GW2011_GWA2_35_9 TaxID=1618333 RepID=A0A0G0DHI7_9BACT|nr:MAG: hypothetical protein UR93_C0019G0006 [Berkelbacteria bacterium GW2011_GWA2_35_9]
MYMRRVDTYNMFVGFTNIVSGIVFMLLGLRFIFKLFSANTQAPFVRWLYDTTGTLIHPFNNIFPSPTVEGGFIFDITTLVALVMYALIFSLIIYIFDVLFTSTTVKNKRVNHEEE